VHNPHVTLRERSYATEESRMLVLEILRFAQDDIIEEDSVTTLSPLQSPEDI
jgi:hypothetical protein